jgi:TRAP-type C4-dicarboxylate transport system permease small subunit
MTTRALEGPPSASAPLRLAAPLSWVAYWLEVYSQAAVRVAAFGAFAGAVIALLAIVVNVFVRQVLGFSLFGASELAAFAFLWTIWMGVSLAVKRGAVTVITLISGRGPAWWQASVHAFSGLSLGVFLAYACWRTTQFAMGEGSPAGVTSALEISWFYPVVSMTVGYYFITLHFLQQATAEGVRVAERGREGLRIALIGLVGGVLIAAVIWAILWLLLAAGAAPLVALGVLFVALTLAGTPIVFMLAIVGIIALFSPSFLGLVFYPSPDAFVPFSVSQFTMGLAGGSELLVILMFLIVAEVLNSSGMSMRLIAFAA